MEQMMSKDLPSNHALRRRLPKSRARPSTASSKSQAIPSRLLRGRAQQVPVNRRTPLLQERGVPVAGVFMLGEAALLARRFSKAWTSAVVLSVVASLIVVAQAMAVTKFNALEATRVLSATTPSDLLRILAFMLFQIVVLSISMVIAILLGALLSFLWTIGSLRESKFTFFMTLFITLSVILYVYAIFFFWGQTVSATPQYLASNSFWNRWFFPGIFGFAFVVGGAIAETMIRSDGGRHMFFKRLIIYVVLISSALSILFTAPAYVWSPKECMQIAVPAGNRAVYASLMKEAHGGIVSVYVIGEKHDQLVILEDQSRRTYLVSKDWIRQDYYCTIGTPKQEAGR
jgi:hypothetical protein